MSIRTAIAFVVAFHLCTAANATQLIVNFSGVQWQSPFLFQGALNELEIHKGEPVHGSFILELDGKVDQYPNDPTQLVVNESVLRAQFQSLTVAAPFGRIGPYGGASVFGVRADGGIGIHANTLYADSDGTLVSDHFQLELTVKPGIIQDDSYDISMLTIGDLEGVGVGASDSRWRFIRVRNALGLDYAWTQYEGYFTSFSVSEVAEPSQAALTMLSVVLVLRFSRWQTRNGVRMRCL